VLDEIESLVRELFNVGADYKVMFLTGGASSQFYMSAMNLLAENETAAFLDTGAWSTKSIKEAKNFGNVNVLASSSDKNYNYIPKGYDIPEDSKYLHLTSNNTIFGTQIHNWPDTKVPFVCDMSSDIFSRSIDVNKFSLIYAGAQKNTGPAGVTLAIVREELLGKTGRQIPTMLDYRTHIAKNSSFNTPPAYPIYVSMLTLRWLKNLGGVSAIEAMNNDKANLLYNEIDRNPLFKGAAATEDRSLMNVTFVMEDDSMNEVFSAAANEAGCVGIKGHRSVGGFRASIYNAMPKDSVQVLVDVMKEFERKA
jgi:phosphoserine aminotransferase